ESRRLFKMTAALSFKFSAVQCKRLNHRLLWHHLLLFTVSIVVVLLLYFTRPYRDFWTKASFSTAYPALLLLFLTLIIGPLNILTRKRNPISSDLRRDVGIW